MAVSFEDDRIAYNALTLLEELDSEQRVGVREAEDGHVIEKDRIESTFLPGTAGGGLTGLLIGIIGGPLGVLIGGAGGLFAGSLFDLMTWTRPTRLRARSRARSGLGTRPFSRSSRSRP